MYLKLKNWMSPVGRTGFDYFHIMWSCKSPDLLGEGLSKVSWKLRLVHHTLQGCKWLCGTPTVCKHALTITDLNFVCMAYSCSCSHDNLLFCMQLCVGFFAQMRLGELTWPEDSKLRDPWKLIKHNSVIINTSSFQFFLPRHKADKFFEGNTIILCLNPFPCDPLTLFNTYILTFSRPPFPTLIITLAQSEWKGAHQVFLHAAPVEVL